MKDILNISANQRLDLPELEHGLQQQAIDAGTHIGAQFLTSPDKVQKWILDGFEVTNPSGTQIQVTKGRGILGGRTDGGTTFGFIATEGEVSRTIDVGAYALAAYGVFIRFELIPSANQSRAFWDPTGGGNEFNQVVATRLTANWSVRIESSQPGPEWLRVATVDTTSGVVITDERPFFFEGNPDAAYESGWSVDGGGGANDRDPDRAEHGAKDLQTFVAAMRQCLEDIKGRGLKRWWDRDIGGMNIGFDADPVAGRLALGDADNYLELSPGNNPRWIVNADGDRVRFDRATNTFHFYFEGTGDVVGVREGAVEVGIPIDGNLVPENHLGGEIGLSATRWAAVSANLLFGYGQVNQNTVPGNSGLVSRQAINSVVTMGMIRVEGVNADIDTPDIVYLDVGPTPPAQGRSWNVNLGVTPTVEGSPFSGPCAIEIPLHTPVYEYSTVLVNTHFISGIDEVPMLNVHGWIKSGGTHIRLWFQGGVPSSTILYYIRFSVIGSPRTLPT